MLNQGQKKLLLQKYFVNYLAHEGYSLSFHNLMLFTKFFAMMVHDVDLIESPFSV